MFGLFGGGRRRPPQQKRAPLGGTRQAFVSHKCSARPFALSNVGRISGEPMTTHGTSRDNRSNRERAIREHLESSHKWSWVEVAVVAVAALGIGWLAKAPWLAVLIAVMWTLKSLLREAINIQAILLSQSLVADTHHLRLVTGISWLLARTDDPTWVERQRLEWNLAEEQSRGPGAPQPRPHSDRFSPEWLIQRFVSADPALGTAPGMWPDSPKQP